jgi:hypothetical protein
LAFAIDLYYHPDLLIFFGQATAFLVRTPSDIRVAIGHLPAVPLHILCGILKKSEEKRVRDHHVTFWLRTFGKNAKLSFINLRLYMSTPALMAILMAALQCLKLSIEWAIAYFAQTFIKLFS